MDTTQQHETSFPVATRPFKGQAAVVTGATSGIGRAIARVLAARGAHVIVSGQDEARGSSVVKEIRVGSGDGGPGQRGNPDNRLVDGRGGRLVRGPLQCDQGGR
jgi:NAD(P)-dependent dehydrogenase (short-subunit alcohol dehydrogenase family)